MNENFVSRQQLSLLPGRVRKAEETNATQDLYRELWKLFENGAKHIMVVGAGGSYPAALCISHSIRYEIRVSDIDVATPQTALRILKQCDHIIACSWKPRYDAIVAISYSGKTPDIRAVYDRCEQEEIPFLLITGEQKEELSSYYDLKNPNLKVISYFNESDEMGKEKGMISMFSTIMPTIIFDDYVNSTAVPIEHYFKEYEENFRNGEEFVSNLDICNIAKHIKKAPVIHVLYDWLTLPTAADIESKFTESGIASVILHEKKNFSHGRYTTLYKLGFGLVINLNRYELKFDESIGQTELVYANSYDAILAEFLKNLCMSKEVPYIEMGNEHLSPTTLNIKEMSKLPYLITSIGEELKIDISKPLKPFPKDAIALYDYKGEF